MTDPEASSSSASPRATFRLKGAHAVRVEQTPPAVESAVNQAQAELGLALRYEVDGAPLLGLAESIVRLRPDAGTLAYLELSKRARHGALLTWLHHTLRGFLSDFDINGYLGTYPLFVLSTEQWRLLLPERDGGRLLDVGAGRGDVTAELAPLFAEVTCVETSRGMARRLRRQGYRVLELDLGATDLGEQFDAVSLLNVLDRCDRPLSLLAQARQVLRPGGALVIALVLPYRPFVYRGSQSSAPAERLPIQPGSSFEQAAAEFVSLALLPLGLRIRAISRAPYLSGGDSARALYELDDLLVVAEAVGDPPPILGGGRRG